MRLDRAHTQIGTYRTEFKANALHKEMWLPLLLCAKPYPLEKRKSAAAYFLLNIVFLMWLANKNSGKKVSINSMDDNRAGY